MPDHRQAEDTLMIERVRRVVMGEPKPRGSEFTHDEEAEPVGTSTKFWFIWGWDEVPKLPHHGAESFVPRSYFPPAGGLRVTAVRFEATGDDDPTEGDLDAPDPDETTKMAVI